MNWTADQEKVIQNRGRNLLVSAAAGSGKTAVLVERIFSLLTDPLNPADIDDILVVTFTKAAASEMRQRIGQRLLDALAVDPENEHLQRQTTLIHNAQITTIDGFCSYVVRNYTNRIELDPGFRITEEGEEKLLRSDVLGNVLEDAFAGEDPEFRAAFTDFVETFAAGKSEAQMEEILMQAYEAAVSAPYPKEWLVFCREENHADTPEEMSRKDWMRDLWDNARELIRTGLSLAKQNEELAKRTDGPSAYLPAAEEQLQLFASLSAAGENYGALYGILTGFHPGRLSGARAKPQEKEELRTRFKETRAEISLLAEDLAENCFPLPPSSAFAFQQKSAGPLDMLLTLTERFMDAFAAEKRKKNLVDFSDLEHFALAILRENKVRTQAAKELAGRFRAVMIDEYQDSNYLQEEILTAVSRIEDGEDNYFCVGDVKQSIYSFRQARPELFMQKFDAYEKDEGGVRIDLHQNFRSRGEILTAVNGLFGQFMRREAGGVEYDESAELVCGRTDAETETDPSVEILTVFTDEDTAEGGTFLDDRRAKTQRQLEARAIAERIRSMVGKDTVKDGRTGVMRPLAYRDIVILLRTMDGWADVFSQVLSECGIPSFSTARTGYFTASEVQTVLDCLRIVDNPEQDIPFAGVLKSAVGGLSAEDLACIRSMTLPEGEKEPAYLYGYARLYAKEGGETGLRERLAAFFERYDSIRSDAPYMRLHELISRIVSESGFLDYISALPGGAQRTANIRMLVEKAVAYEQTSYIGLFNFVRYIENLQKYAVDFGEASALGENENTVRIISVHKSKGLEYPVVFAAGMGKHFNRDSLRRTVLIHPLYGFASGYTDYSGRVACPTLKRLCLRQRLLKENVGEDLRILYVALTRAKEKLILTGTMKDSEKMAEAMAYEGKERYLGVTKILRAQCPWDLLLPAAARLRDGSAGPQQGLPDHPPIVFREVRPSQLVGAEIKNESRAGVVLEKLKTLDPTRIYDPEMKTLLSERFSFRYPFEGEGGIPVKVSVSDLKHAQMEEEEEEGFRTYEEPTVIPLVPDFMKEGKEEETLSGSDRGTAYHRFLSRIDFSQDLKEQVDALAERGILKKKEAAGIFLPDIKKLLADRTGQRMAAAQRGGKLTREQPFVIGVPASRIKEEWPSGETILVQGIIDVFFEEERKIVLLDYKTDFVKTDKELIRRYRIQLDLYAEALEKATGLEVKEKIIWSFCLAHAIVF